MSLHQKKNCLLEQMYIFPPAVVRIVLHNLFKNFIAFTMVIKAGNTLKIRKHKARSSINILYDNSLIKWSLKNYIMVKMHKLRHIPEQT